MRKIICDRCKKDISHQEVVGYIAIQERDVKTSFFDGFNPHEHKDFCEKCIQEINTFIDCKSDKVQAEKVKREKIDAGKVMALKNAGWSNKDIAEELRVDSQAIANTIYKKKKEANDDNNS